MARRIRAIGRQRRVAGDDVALSEQFVERREGVAALAFLAGRIVEQDAHTERQRRVSYAPPDVPHADNAKRRVSKSQTPLADDGDECGGDILSDRGGVATGRVHPADAGASAVIRVDMVVTDGRGDNQANATAGKQRRVAMRAGTSEKHIRVTHIVSRDRSARQVGDVSIRFHHTPQKRDLIVSDDSHLLVE